MKYVRKQKRMVGFGELESWELIEISEMKIKSDATGEKGRFIAEKVIVRPHVDRNASSRDSPGASIVEFSKYKREILRERTERRQY